MDFLGIAVIVLVLAAIQIAEAQEYTVKVTPTCPKAVTKDGFATVKILTDLPDTQPLAYCKGEKTYKFEISLEGLWEMPVFFQGDVNNGCVFQKKLGTGVYSVMVQVPEAVGLLIAKNNPHVISCTYDPTGVYKSKPAQFKPGLHPIHQIAKHMSVVSKSHVKLCIMNIRGKCITTRVPLGKTIRLVAEMTGNIKGELSLQTLSCKAVGAASSYPLVISGCGDGIVFRKAQGFTTKAKIATSPYFKSFRLPGSKTVNFDCTFVVCDKNCDGNSCALAMGRKKRSSPQRYIRKQLSFHSIAEDNADYEQKGQGLL